MWIKTKSLHFNHMLVIWYKIHCAGVLRHVGGPCSVWKALLSLWHWIPGGGRLCGCGRGGVGRFKAVTYLWHNPQSFKQNLLFISCSSYLSEHRRTVDVFMDLPLIRVWFLASGDWLVCMSAEGASVRLGQSRAQTEITSSSLSCSNWKSQFTQLHQQQDGLQQLQQEQNPQRPGAHGPNWMWVFPPLKHLKQVWGKLERREQPGIKFAAVKSL